MNADERPKDCMEELTLAVAVVLSPIAGLMAAAITYEEYSHHYPDHRRPLKLAVQAGLAAFVAFMVLAFVAGFFLNAIVSPPP